MMTRINAKFSKSDLSCAYHRVPLSPETQKLTVIIISGRQCTYTRVLYGPCGLPNFFSRLMTIRSDHLVMKKQAITYIVDAIRQSHDNNQMFRVIEDNHILFWKLGSKVVPDNTFYPQKEINPSRNELKTRRISNRLKVKGMS